MNIYMYLYLKSTKINVQNHPVIKRLFQYRQLLLHLEPIFDEVVKPQIEVILAEASDNDKSAEIVEKKKKTLKFLTSLNKKPEVNETNMKKKKRNSASDDVQAIKKKIKFANDVENLTKKNKKLDKSSDESADEAIVEEKVDADVEGKEGNHVFWIRISLC